ncbi:hypothetical protein D3C86_1371770 [compost metagenome]
MLQVAAEVLFKLFDPRCVTRIAFARSGEDVRNFLVTMHVEEHIDAVLFHLLLYEKDFRAGLLAGVLPGAIEVLAHGVGAQVAVESTIRVHVWHQVQVGAGQQFIQHRVVVFFQTFDHAFHEPLGHVFARMLLGNHPHLASAFGPGAFAQQLDVAAFDTFAGGQQLGTGLAQRLLDQPVVAATAVGFEVGKPGVSLFGFEAEAQAVAFKNGRYAEPVDVIVGRHRLITGPGLVIGGLAGIVQAKPVLLADMQAAGLEVEPLEMGAAGVRANGQKRFERIADVDDLDVAAVEVGTDVERGFSHGHNRVLNMIIMAATLHARVG